MCNNLTKILVASLLLPISSFAMPLNNYFTQGITINNSSDSSISITDAASATLQNYSLSPGYYIRTRFASDKFTNPKGQSFSHTVNIYSGIDHSLICTVTSHLELSLTGSSQTKPTSSNPAKCDGSTLLTADQNGVVYGFEIDVKN